MHLKQRLRSLSTELVTLRNRLHVNGPNGEPVNGGNSNATNQNTSKPASTNGRQPHIPPRGSQYSSQAATLVISSQFILNHLNCFIFQLDCFQASSQKSVSSSIIQPFQNTTSATIEDLIHLPGPLTEDAVMKCLQARFAANQFYVSFFFVLLF